MTKCAVEGAFMDVAAAFKNFFEGRKAGRKTGFPRFKSKKRSCQSFYLANDKFTVGDHWIDVPKLGRVNMSEKLRFSGKILSARISKQASWWFVAITVEIPDEVPLNTSPPVGVDVGLHRLATLVSWQAVRKPETAGPAVEKATVVEQRTGSTTHRWKELAQNEGQTGPLAL